MRTHQGATGSAKPMYSPTSANRCSAFLTTRALEVATPKALSIAREVNTPHHEARALEGIGLCDIQEQDYVEGAANLQQALGIYQRIHAPEAERAEEILRSEKLVSIKETSGPADYGDTTRCPAGT
jgi:hypothetical protein